MEVWKRTADVDWRGKMAGHFKQTSWRLEQAHYKRNSARHLLLHSACDCETILTTVRFPSLLQGATGRGQSSLCQLLKGPCHLDRVLWSVAQAATVRHWGEVGRQAVGSDGPTSRVSSGSAPTPMSYRCWVCFQTPEPHSLHF